MKIERIVLNCMFMAAILWDVSGASGEPAAKKGGQMLEVFTAFKNLQVYVAQQDAFLSPANEKKIYLDLKKMRDGFHSLDSLGPNLKARPGFASNLRQAEEVLSDILIQYRQGNKAFVRRELKGLSALCISCHATNQIRLSFADQKDPAIGKLDLFEQGEYFFATRQFTKASEAYLAAARQGEKFRMAALRKWLVIKLRAENAPGEALATIEQISKEGKLGRDDRNEIEAWRKSLLELGTPEPSQSGGNLALARSLIAGGISLATGELALSTDYVKLLSATAALHIGFDRDEFSGKDRAEALYLLGLCYSRLSPAFIDDLPELYLEQCIDEFPDSREAKSSFLLYRELMTGKYFGLPPDDVNLKLRELYNRAYGVPEFKERT